MPDFSVNFLLAVLDQVSDESFSSLCHDLLVLLSQLFYDGILTVHREVTGGALLAFWRRSHVSILHILRL